MSEKDGLYDSLQQSRKEKVIKREMEKSSASRAVSSRERVNRGRHGNAVRVR